MLQNCECRKTQPFKTNSDKIFECCVECNKIIRIVDVSQINLDNYPPLEFWNPKKLKTNNAVINKAVSKRQKWFQEYSKYLNSKDWKKLRKEVLRRDSGLCQFCKIRKAVHVHHLSYKNYNKLGYSTKEELISLCRKCHQNEHPEKKL